MLAHGYETKALVKKAGWWRHFCDLVLLPRTKGVVEVKTYL